MFRSTNEVQRKGGVIMLLGWKSAITQKYSNSNMQLSNLFFFLNWNYTIMPINT